jgi:hypothetical protein
MAQTGFRDAVGLSSGAFLSRRWSKPAPVQQTQLFHRHAIYSEVVIATERQRGTTQGEIVGIFMDLQAGSVQ